jgi:aspartokinase
MVAAGLDMTEKLSINGLKLSDPLTSIWIHAPNQTVDRLPLFCRLLAQGQINIAFLTAASIVDSKPVLCCIDTKDHPAVAERVEHNGDLKGCVRFGGTVGVITFYPHQSNLKLMGLALHVLSRSGIRVHGMASSIAALSFVIDFDRLEEAGRLLMETLQLPDNAAPVRSEFKVHQERRPQ